ncbi:NPCBM/NEW2 domain-containing protein, partial [Akkermansiaceae bacterium]|nr:NPCBM/NEW2 domain-containing protein [Akkermansiaceae bacterium]
QNYGEGVYIFDEFKMATSWEELFSEKALPSNTPIAPKDSEPTGLKDLNLAAGGNLKATGNDFLDEELKKAQAAWLEKRKSIVSAIEVKFLDTLKEKIKSLVKEGDLVKARAFKNASEGKVGDAEPAELTELRLAASKRKRDAVQPLDKSYWEKLKEIREVFRQEGSLRGVEVLNGEINRLLAPYANQDKTSQKAAKSSSFTKPRQGKVESISLTKLEPNSLMAGGVEEGGKWWRVHTPLSDQSVKVGGLDCKSFIFAHAPSRATYKVPSFAKFFSAMGSSRAGISYKFIITIDGEVVFESRSLENYENNCVPIIVEIPEGSKVIGLLVDEMGSMNNDNSAWANPMFRSKKPTPRQVLSLK